MCTRPPKSTAAFLSSVDKYCPFHHLHPPRFRHLEESSLLHSTLLLSISMPGQCPSLPPSSPPLISTPEGGIHAVGIPLHHPPPPRFWCRKEGRSLPHLQSRFWHQEPRVTPPPLVSLEIDAGRGLPLHSVSPWFWCQTFPPSPSPFSALFQEVNPSFTPSWHLEVGCHGWAIFFAPYFIYKTYYVTECIILLSLIQSPQWFISTNTLQNKLGRWEMFLRMREETIC